MAVNKITKDIAIYGSNCSPAELLFIYRTFKSVDFFYLDYYDLDFVSDDAKQKLLLYQRLLPVKIRFITPENTIPESYDAQFCMSTCFRSVAPSKYNHQNNELKKAGINTNYPLWSDRNSITTFVKCVFNLYRLLLSRCKTGGYVVVHPTAVSFSVFKSFEKNFDFTILDKDPPGVNWESSRSGVFPSYSTSPITLQIESNAAYFDDSFVASELLKKNTLPADATFSLTKVAPELGKFFSKKGVLVVPSVFSNGSCIRKDKHVSYNVDLKLLKYPLQLSTAAMSRMSEGDLLTNPDKQRVASRLWYGSRYFLSRQPSAACEEMNRKWFREAYSE